MKGIRQRIWLLPVLALAAILLGSVFIVSSGSTEAQAAAGGDHGGLVTEFPRRDVPVVLDGRVLAHAQVGNRIFVGGDFQQVELPNGITIDQPYLFAYDINSGLLDPNFRPALNNVVRALEPTQAGDGLYVGGLFTRWDNSFPLRIAKLDAQGNLNTSFGPRASARVQDIVEVGNSVYLGGDFIQVSGEPARGLVKVDRVTGAVDTTFLPQFTDSQNGSNIVRRLDVTPDGQSLFVLHYAWQVDGQSRQAVAKFDLNGDATPTMSTWHIRWVAQNFASNCWAALRDMAISPDGSFIVIGGQGADNPPNCDSVLRYPTAGTSEVTFQWSARMYSSVFSLAVSDVAVYAGGHFCAAPRNPAPVGGVTSSWPGTANFCDVNDPLHPLNPSSLDPNGAVFRSQMAALDPATGQALDWDPGSNNLVAVYDLTLIDRGLLAGHDRNRFNNFDVGRSGFFDFAENVVDDEAPTIAVTQPAQGGIVSNLTGIGGTASDNFDVEEVVIRLFNESTDQWLQLDGSFGPTRVDLPVTTTTIGLGQVFWSTPVSDLPAGDYEIRGFARDGSGNFSAFLESEFMVPGASQCSVSLNAQGQPVISYSEFAANGVDSIIVRRDGKWLASAAAGSGTFVDTDAAPGDHTYLIRWRPVGPSVDVPCSPASITVPTPVATATCSAGLNAQGEPVVSWNIDGADRVAVREATRGFVSIVEGSTSFTDATAAPGDHSYIVRYWPAAGRTDIACTPQSITVPVPGGNAGPTCTATVLANGNVQLDWSAIDGEDKYIVRDNNGFVATVNNALTYTDTTPTTGYVIRSREGGVTTNVSCV